MLGQPEGRKWPPWGASPIPVVTGRLPSHTNCWSDSVKHFVHSHFLMTFLNVKMQFFIWDFFDLCLSPPSTFFDSLQDFQKLLYICLWTALQVSPGPQALYGHLPSTPTLFGLKPCWVTDSCPGTQFVWESKAVTGLDGPFLSVGGYLLRRGMPYQDSDLAPEPTHFITRSS